MDYYAEGRRWFDRWADGSAYALYGRYIETHRRALLKLTNNSEEWLAARKGFNDRMREFSQMSMAEIDAIVQRNR